MNIPDAFSSDRNRSAPGPAPSAQRRTPAANRQAFGRFFESRTSFFPERQNKASLQLSSPFQRRIERISSASDLFILNYILEFRQLFKRKLRKLNIILCCRICQSKTGKTNASQPARIDTGSRGGSTLHMFDQWLQLGVTKLFLSGTNINSNNYETIDNSNSFVFLMIFYRNFQCKV